MLANSLAYVLRYTYIAETFLYSWIGGIVFTALAIIGIVLLISDKKKLKGVEVE